MRQHDTIYKHELAPPAKHNSKLVHATGVTDSNTCLRSHATFSVKLLLGPLLAPFSLREHTDQSSTGCQQHRHECSMPYDLRTIAMHKATR